MNTAIVPTARNSDCQFWSVLSQKSGSRRYLAHDTVIWSWFAQSVSGWSEYNADRLEHEQSSLSWVGYLGSADFWQTTLQNWQSEFLAVGSMAVLAIYLRQRGSPESKPVGCPHHSTSVEG